jgi:hydrogenase maturation protease
MRCAVADVLVIGYGNELRGDDGLGPLVAKGVASADISGVRVLIARQLLPEFAADLAQARLVVFVDASEAWSESGIEVRPLAVENVTDWCTHQADPRTLLALTQAIYGQTPEAWWLTVLGRNFELGERLSGMAEENARQALVYLKRLIQPKSSHRISRPLRKKNLDRMH